MSKKNPQRNARDWENMEINKYNFILTKKCR